MKKFILFLFAALMIQPVFAQKKLTKEIVKPYLTEAMAEFTEGVRPYYKKGMTAEEFEAALLGKDRNNNSKTGKEIIYKAFRYIEAGTKRADIIAKDSGVEMAQAFVITELLKQKNPKSTGSELFGMLPGPTDPPVTAEGSRCRWFQIGCHLRNLATVMVNYATTICGIAAFFDVPCDPILISGLGDGLLYLLN